MAETVVVCVIVGGVLILAGRSFYRTVTGKSDGCGCGTRSGCAAGLCDRIESHGMTEEDRPHD